MVLVRSMRLRRSFGFDIAPCLWDQFKECFVLEGIKVTGNVCAVHEPKFGQYQNFGGAVTLSGVPGYIAPSYPYHSGHTP